jgi:hypothetical protein
MAAELLMPPPIGGEPSKDQLDYVEFTRRLFAALRRASRIRGCSDWLDRPVLDLGLRDEYHQWENDQPILGVGTVRVSYTLSQEVPADSVDGTLDADETMHLIRTRTRNLAPADITDITVHGAQAQAYVLPTNPTVALSALLTRVRQVASRHMTEGQHPATINRILRAVGMEALPEPVMFEVTMTVAHTETVRAVDADAAREWLTSNVVGARRSVVITTAVVADATVTPQVEGNNDERPF